MLWSLLGTRQMRSFIMSPSPLCVHCAGNPPLNLLDVIVYMTKFWDSRVSKCMLRKVFDMHNFDATWYLSDAL